MSLQLADLPEIDTDTAVALIDAYPEQTLQLYDGGPSSGQDSIGPVEIGRLIVIEPLSQDVAGRVLEAAPRAPLHLVPVDARLADADPEGELYWRAGELFEHFVSVNGVGLTIASKLLHLKRPGFFPILDSVVQKVYDQPARKAYQQSERGKKELPHANRLYWAAMRSDVVSPANQMALGQIRNALAVAGKRRLLRAAAVSDTRLIDILLWRLIALSK